MCLAYPGELGTWGAPCLYGTLGFHGNYVNECAWPARVPGHQQTSNATHVKASLVKRFISSWVGPSSLAAPKLPVLGYFCTHVLAVDAETPYYPPAASQVKPPPQLKGWQENPSLWATVIVTKPWFARNIIVDLPLILRHAFWNTLSFFIFYSDLSLLIVGVEGFVASDHTQWHTHSVELLCKRHRSVGETSVW